MIMKRLKGLLFIVIIGLTCVGTLNASDLQNGVFGLEWGASLSRLNDFSKLGSSSHVDYYIKPGEVRAINQVTVPEVIYGSYSDQFFAVYIKIDTIEVFDDFRRYIKSKYGIPKKTVKLKNDQTEYRWKYKEIKIKLKLYGKKNEMKLAFYYTPLSNKVNEAQEEKFQRESFRLFPIDKNKTPEMIPLLQF